MTRAPVLCVRFCCPLNMSTKYNTDVFYRSHVNVWVSIVTVFHNRLENWAVQKQYAQMIFKIEKTKLVCSFSLWVYPDYRSRLALYTNMRQALHHCPKREWVGLGSHVPWYHLRSREYILRSVLCFAWISWYTVSRSAVYTTSSSPWKAE